MENLGSTGVPAETPGKLLCADEVVAAGCYETLRSLSMPEFHEMKDIRAFEEVLFRNGEYKSDCVGGLFISTKSSGDLAVEAMRVLSMGLQRSTSLPREAHLIVPESTIKRNESSGSFFIDDESTQNEPQRQQSSFIPKFYSKEELKNVIPPTSIAYQVLPPSSSTPTKSLRQSSPFTSLSPLNSSLLTLPGSPKTKPILKPKLCESSPSILKKSSSRVKRREAAAQELTDFFFGRSNETRIQKDRSKTQRLGT